MLFDLDFSARVGSREVACIAQSDDRVLAITGPSGIGKTSVLNAIAGLITPECGHIAVRATRLFDHARGIDLPVQKRRAGYVFQDNRLFAHRRVGANLGFAERLAGTPLIAREEIVDVLGIGHLMRRWPASLSGGEAKRVAIGRALLSAPRFLLLDEPLASVDPARRDDILALIERIRDDFAMPIVYVSHDAAEVARLTDAVVSLGDELQLARGVGAQRDV